ncbi:U3 small nucleolar RNA-associated protein [Lambiella insularis]|nr:U3 small nucleolar RNA-associated protein [Lambiella insularis]
MDIHRCRFVPYPASTINALAFSHTPSDYLNKRSPPNLRLAVGRANGNIEIWNPQRGQWVQESILRGGRDRGIEGLVWTHDLESIAPDGIRVAGKIRLFSIGYSTVITEWDLALGTPIRHSGGNYGEIWCIGAQPRWPAPAEAIGHPTQDHPKDAEQLLAVGCVDGTIVLHSIADSELRLLRTLARPSGKKSRVLCVTFLGHERVVAGHADSTIRIFNARTGRQLSSMSLGAGRPGGPSEILVWSIKCLPDGTIVSGDSNGELRFWDGQNYTLLQQIKSHKEDILDLAVSADGLTIFSAGMDRRTTLYRSTSNSRDVRRRSWAEISHQRHHSHDVKTMATFESRDLSIVASGGIDSTPVIIPLREYGKQHTLSLSMLPNRPALQSAPQKRLIMSWWDREILIWRLGPRRRDSRPNDDCFSDSQARNLVAKVVVQGEENIASASISSQGDMLAVSTVSGLKIFYLRFHRSSDVDSLKVQKAQIPNRLSRRGSKMVQFSPDSRWLLVVRYDDSIHLNRIVNESSAKAKRYISDHAVELQRVPRSYAIPDARHGTYGDYEKSIIRSAWSGDSRILVVSDLRGYLDSWVLEGYEDLTQGPESPCAEGVPVPTSKGSDNDDGNDNEASDEDSRPNVILGQHWIRVPQTPSLPRLPSFPLVMSFRPAKPQSPEALSNGNAAIHPTRRNLYPHSHDLPQGDDRLFVVTSLHKLYEYQILTGKLSDWSRRNPPSVLPEDFRAIRDRVMECVWDVSGVRDRVWIYGSTWLWMFDLARDLPAIERKPVEKGGLPNQESQNETKSSKKRKLPQDPGVQRELMRATTGAGSKITDEEINLGISNKMRRSTGSEQSQVKWVTFDTIPRAVAASDKNDDHDSGISDDSEIGRSTLVSLRRRQENQTSVQHRTNGDSEPSIQPDAAVLRNTENGPAYWHTYKYRPILGMVTLEDGLSIDDRGGADRKDVSAFHTGVEVALVERPEWEIDLPPRYYGDQEWEK